MKAEYIDHMGDDLKVVNAARVSFDKESEWEYDCVCDRGPCDSNCPNGDNPHLGMSDKKLIQYLAKHDHWTPFAHTAIKFRMQAPVPIRTQCFKHKQGMVENEESRRYISGVPELYIPEFFRVVPEGSIKQGSGDVHPESAFIKRVYYDTCMEGIREYEWMISKGVCPEQARFVLPQGVLVNWIWTGNLYSYANFYNKRTDTHAQKEIQELAQLVGKELEKLFPVSWSALTNG